MLLLNEVTFDALLEMSESDLKELGLAKGPRIKMMRTAEKFRATQSTVSMSGGGGITAVVGEAREAPEEFFCPISHELMQDPVFVCVSHNYLASVCHFFLVLAIHSPGHILLGVVYCVRRRG
jgi:hypothetical protein